VLQIDKYSLKKKSTMATTYMNISAILSNMGKYTESYKLAKKANIMFLELKEDQLNSMAQGGSSFEPSSNHQSQYGANEQPVLVNFIVSYFNMGIAAECTGNKKLAYEHASQGYHFSLVDLGEEHRLTMSIRNYLDKLAEDITQGMAIRPPNKNQKIEPSARQHDTSYMSGKHSENGIADISQGNSYKPSQLRSQRDKSTYNPADRSIAIDDDGKHYLKFTRNKDEISIVADSKFKKPPKRSRTTRPKTLADIKPSPTESLVDKRRRMQSQRRTKDNELALMLQNIAVGKSGRSTSVRIRISSRNEKSRRDEFSNLQQLTFNNDSISHHQSREKKVRPPRKYLDPVEAKTESFSVEGGSRKQFSKMPTTVEDKERWLMEKEAELDARERLLKKLANAHEVEMFQKRQLVKAGDVKTEKKESISRSNSKPKVENTKNHDIVIPQTNPPSKLEGWLQARYAQPINRVGGLQAADGLKSNETEINMGPTLSGEPSPDKVSHLDSGDVSKGREYLNRKYNTQEIKPKDATGLEPNKYQKMKIDPNHYDRDEEEALVEYRKRLKENRFPGVEAHIEDVKNQDRSKSPVDTKKPNTSIPEIDPEDIYFNQFSSVGQQPTPKESGIPGQNQETRVEGQFYEMDSNLKKTNSWANRTNYGMKKVVAYNLKYVSTSEN
jgi:hypothetical protein